jgi:hypothetical protein
VVCQLAALNGRCWPYSGPHKWKSLSDRGSFCTHSFLIEFSGLYFDSADQSSSTSKCSDPFTWTRAPLSYFTGTDIGVIVNRSEEVSCIVNNGFCYANSWIPDLARTLISWISNSLQHWQISILVCLPPHSLLAFLLTFDIRNLQTFDAVDSAPKSSTSDDSDYAILCHIRLSYSTDLSSDFSTATLPWARVKVILVYQLSRCCMCIWHEVLRFTFWSFT